jgi:hypothetical protein
VRASPRGERRSLTSGGRSCSGRQQRGIVQSANSLLPPRNDARQAHCCWPASIIVRRRKTDTAVVQLSRGSSRAPPPQARRPLASRKLRASVMSARRLVFARTAGSSTSRANASVMPLPEQSSSCMLLCPVSAPSSTTAAARSLHIRMSYAGRRRRRGWRRAGGPRSGSADRARPRAARRHVSGAAAVHAHRPRLGSSSRSRRTATPPTTCGLRGSRSCSRCRPHPPPRPPPPPPPRRCWRAWRLAPAAPPPRMRCLRAGRPPARAMGTSIEGVAAPRGRKFTG